MYNIFEILVILIFVLCIFLFIIFTASALDRWLNYLLKKELQKRNKIKVAKYQKCIYDICNSATATFCQEFIGQRKSYINELIKIYKNF